MFHMLVFYGFISAFVATVIAAIMQDVFGQEPPYPILSAPVIFGSIGGIAMIVGATGLLSLKWRSDREPADGSSMNLDWLFLLSLNVVSITGMLLLILRETPLMGVAAGDPPGDGPGAVRVGAVWQVRALPVSLRGADPEPHRIALSRLSSRQKVTSQRETQTQRSLCPIC